VKCRLLFLVALVHLRLACSAEPSANIATNPPVNSGSGSSTNNPVEAEYGALLELDDAAAAEIDAWILGNQKFEEQGAGVPREELGRRIQKRREPVRASYESFIAKHPGHSRARLAFASFLEDSGDLDGALEQMLKAKEVDPTNPAAWNNLANYYGHFGEVTNAFSHYEKAIELDPNEPVYYQNFGTTVFLFRTAVKQYYGIDEQQVFDKALALYSNSLALDPTNFLLATDIAMTYYGIRPPRSEEATKAWKYALSHADGSLQREGVLIHLGRVALNAGQFSEARAYLNSVTNAELVALRDRVMRNVEKKEHSSTESPTNSAPGMITNATTLVPLP